MYRQQKIMVMVVMEAVDVRSRLRHFLGGAVVQIDASGVCTRAFVVSSLAINVGGFDSSKAATLFNLDSS